MTQTKALWLIDMVAPFGGTDAMLKQLSEQSRCSPHLAAVSG